MARRGSGIGMILLVVTLVIVMLLVARSFKSVAPTALQIPDEPLAGTADDESGTLPDLDDMRRETDAHAQQVQDAVAATN